MKLVVATKEEIAKDIANRVISLIKDNPKAVLGLATGSSPLETYAEIIKRKDEVSFKYVTSFNLDEYLDNGDVTQSYRYFMDTNLFNHIDINKENTHFPSKENLSSYDDEILAAGGIDFQILGIGSDGHIAFNEPNTPFDSKTHVAELDERTIKDNSRFFKSIDDVPTKAVTMGLATIMQAKEIVLIAIGKNKSKAVKEMFEKNNDVSCPACILNKHPNVTVYINEEVDFRP